MAKEERKRRTEPEPKEEKGRKAPEPMGSSKRDDGDMSARVIKRVMDSTTDPMGAPRNEPKEHNGGQRKEKEEAYSRGGHGAPKMDRKRNSDEME